MKIKRGPIALVVLALAAEIAYIFIKGSKETATAGKDRADTDDKRE